MIVPSVFFIAPETGLPLEVSMGQVDAGQLLEKFNKALQVMKEATCIVFTYHSERPRQLSTDTVGWFHACAWAVTGDFFCSCA